MQNTGTIINWPILAGLLLSVAIHAAMLNNRATYTPPMPQMATGRTVVHLTLLPSLENKTRAPQPTASPILEQEDPEAQANPENEHVMKEPAKPETIEQPAASEEDKGVIAEAVATSTFHPSYPRISERRGEEGTVILSVLVRGNGTVGHVEILQSSGFRRLDQAAVKGAQRTTYEPATQSRHPVESTIQLSFTFELTDD